MTTALPACLLLLALGLQIPAHGNGGGQATDGGSKTAKNKVVSGRPAPLAQDTARDNTSRLATGLQITIAAGQLSKMAILAPTSAPEQPGSPEMGPLAEVAEFNSETANLPASLASTLRRPEAPMGRRTYRTRLVRTGRWASKPEAVEILTSTYAGPLVLAQLPATPAMPSQLFAGPGYDPTTPLRPLALTQEAVLRLCGDRAPQVRAYAMLYNLHFQQADEVARLLDYYNRIAVAK